MVRQCELLGLPRSSYYYSPGQESAENLKLMRMIDEEYTRAPFYGVRRLTERLRRLLGEKINHKRVHRLMRLMGISAIYPKKRLSQGNKNHRKYPYLLGGVRIERVNQVWSTDITYIPMASGYLYLVAILDWYSRYVISWELSNTLETGFCLIALERALEQGKPEIFNSDQGVQFTSCLLYTSDAADE